jgi:hypothetical protein
MKKIIAVLLVLVLTVDSCKKVEEPVYVPQKKVYNNSGDMSFAYAPEIKAGELIISINSTIGSKYLFQLNDFSGNTVLSRSLTSDEIIETIKIDVSKVEPGVYDVIAFDTRGNETKNPILIK